MGPVEVGAQRAVCASTATHPGPGSITAPGSLTVHGEPAYADLTTTRLRSPGAATYTISSPGMAKTLTALSLERVVTLEAPASTGHSAPRTMAATTAEMPAIKA